MMVGSVGCMVGVGVVRLVRWGVYVDVLLLFVWGGLYICLGMLGNVPSIILWMEV